MNFGSFDSSGTTEFDSTGAG